jgi:DNA-binding transcriptional LysR family regulator
MPLWLKIVAATGRTAGTLRINTLSYAARKLIAPRLGGFHCAYPDVVLDIVIDDGMSDIGVGRFDAGIRVGERLEKDMIAVRLTPDMAMLAVASPDYLTRRGTSMPASIGRFPGSGAIYRSELAQRSTKIEMAVEGPLISNLQEVVLEGALQGLGILYSYDDERIYESIAAGCLRRVLVEWSPTLPNLFLYYSDGRNASPTFRASIDCLLDRDK